MTQKCTLVVQQSLHFCASRMRMELNLSLPLSYDFGRTNSSNTSSDVHLPDRAGMSDSPTQDNEDSRASSPSPTSSSRSGVGKQSKTRGSRFISALKSSLGGSSQGEGEVDGSQPQPESISSGQRVDAFVPPSSPPLRRILYTANAGDARAVPVPWRKGHQVDVRS